MLGLHASQSPSPTTRAARHARLHHLGRVSRSGERRRELGDSPVFGSARFSGIAPSLLSSIISIIQWPLSLAFEILAKPVC